ncbi:hypothetical protein DI09_62p90 [Mitosporidium daphniae]|uniref:CBS domain-containing protein n=1 Tax=Mitosporidium daphniae TaxID=1485682 RepID=A0A098VNQ9_9MICR|nr:uncharacterized protein DI09_62p90 [Mitosporidium daphniae]KGG50605.1 hypothetical protein DI09_62p90 [Mitosporidium daphniae]|eukprot:XP_013237049.1 uncharacterized protein DI09_62p90 [Mitosporidium daphniae]
MTSTAGSAREPVDLLGNRRKTSLASPSDFAPSQGAKKGMPANRASQAPQKFASKGFASNASSITRADALEPSVIVPHTSTVLQACQKMASLRASSLLVVEDVQTTVPSVLIGIVTDKDIAYKVIAEGLDPAIVLISSIMTPNPITIQSGTSMNDALQIMTDKHFRHLPVVSAFGEIEGVLDITLAMRGAIEKLRKSEELTRSLTSAVGHVTQDHHYAGTEQLMGFTQLLKKQLSTPEVAGIFASSLLNTSASCLLKTTIRSAAITMKAASSTAVLVLDESGSLIGIFTSKDIVRRVISCKLDPLRTTLTRVMTPNPETISLDSSLLLALEKMYAGKYLHLPVIKEDGHSSLIDILDICIHVIGKEIDFEGFFSAPSSCVTDNSSPHIQDEFTEDDTASVTSLETNASSKISKGNRWSFKVRNGSNVVYVHIQQPLHSALVLAVKEKLCLDEPFSISFKDSENDLVPIFNDDDLVSLIEMILGSSSGASIDAPITLFVAHAKDISVASRGKALDWFGSLFKDNILAVSVSCGIAGILGTALLYRKLK